ncbi:MAG: reactive intermediate/imine deaminase [Proteobacteria bacterium]|nr:MAG: reactive intermediate/imine deaminase [Pseudomonadota bacterium]
MSHPLHEIRSSGAPAPIGPYSQAIAVGDLLFASGQIPLDPATGKLVEGGIEAQTERVLANVKGILAAAGLSLARVVKVSVFLADLGDFAAMNEIYARHFDAFPKPARSTFQVAKLPAGARIEMEVIAVR